MFPTLRTVKVWISKLAFHCAKPIRAKRPPTIAGLPDVILQFRCAVRPPFSSDARSQDCVKFGHARFEKPFYSEDLPGLPRRYCVQLCTSFIDHPRQIRS